MTPRTNHCQIGRHHSKDCRKRIRDEKHHSRLRSHRSYCDHECSRSRSRSRSRDRGDCNGLNLILDLTLAPTVAKQKSSITNADFVNCSHLNDDVASSKEEGEEEETQQQSTNNRKQNEQNNIKELSVSQFKTMIYNELSTKGSEDTRLTAPIYCDGHQLEAQADIGATKSFIDEAVVDCRKSAGQHLSWAQRHPCHSDRRD